MAISKKRAIIGGIFISLTVGGLIAGYFALDKTLSKKYSVDLEAEEAKAFFVGTYVDENYPISVHVSLVSPVGTIHEKNLVTKDFNFNTSGQQSAETIWCNLTDFAAEATGGERLDTWIELGGKIRFDSTRNGATSVVKTCNWGGGSYLVNAPDDDGGLKVTYAPVSLYIVEDYVL